MIGAFEELLEELGKIFHLLLHIDHMNACSIQVSENLTIQLEPDMAQENLWIFCKVIEIPPGKFRENVLRDALKANGLPDPRIGHFGYIENTGHLALFQKYPLNILNGERLAGFIGAFLEMAARWQKGIANGHTDGLQ